MIRRPDDRDVHGAALAVLAERLHDAVMLRDLALVEALLEAREASRLPREVREEALAVVRRPAGSYRAPMQLLRFHHRMLELAQGVLPGDVRAMPAADDGPVRREAPVDPAQIEIFR